MLLVCNLILLKYSQEEVKKDEGKSQFFLCSAEPSWPAFQAFWLRLLCSLRKPQSKCVCPSSHPFHSFECSRDNPSLLDVSVHITPWVLGFLGSKYGQVYLNNCLGLSPIEHSKIDFLIKYPFLLSEGNTVLWMPFRSNDIMWNGG